MTERIRIALLFLVLVAFFAARAGGALGADTRTHSTSAARERVELVKYARTLIGVPYTYGGTTPRTGFDCSGFTRYVYARFGIDLPHYSGAQYGMGRPVARASLRAGDLVFFDDLGHVGIYVGGGRYIHAAHSGTTVSIEPMASHGSYVGARRFI